MPLAFSFGLLSLLLPLLLILPLVLLLRRLLLLRDLPVLLPFGRMVFAGYSHSPPLRFVCGVTWLLSYSGVLRDLLASFSGFGPCGSCHDPRVVLLEPHVGAVMPSRSPGRPHSPLWYC